MLIYNIGMNLGLNPLAPIAAAFSLGAHVAVFGVLLADPAAKPIEVVRLVDIVVAPAQPAPLSAPQATTPAMASAPREAIDPDPTAAPPEPDMPKTMAARVDAKLPEAARDISTPINRATPRSKPVIPPSKLEIVSIAEPTDVAHLSPLPGRKSAVRSVPDIETRISIAPGNAQPRYPLSARKRGYEGQTVIRVGVSESGQVFSTVIAESSGYEILDLAARDAVASWRFRPAIRDGRPAAGQIDVPIEFRLR